MTGEQLTALLAERVMGWGVAPGRYLMGGRRWVPRWRFQPEQNLQDAFRLLEKAHPERYAMGAEKTGEFWVRVQIAGGVGGACDASKPKAITLAVARAIGIDVEANG